MSYAAILVHARGRSGRRSTACLRLRARAKVRRRPDRAWSRDSTADVLWPRRLGDAGRMGRRHDETARKNLRARIRLSRPLRPDSQGAHLGTGSRHAGPCHGARLARRRHIVASNPPPRSIADPISTRRGGSRLDLGKAGPRVARRRAALRAEDRFGLEGYARGAPRLYRRYALLQRAEAVTVVEICTSRMRRTLDPHGRCRRGPCRHGVGAQAVVLRGWSGTWRGIGAPRQDLWRRPDRRRRPTATTDWANGSFGGVTRDLLRQEDVHLLLSH